MKFGRVVSTPRPGRGRHLAVRRRGKSVGVASPDPPLSTRARVAGTPPGVALSELSETLRGGVLRGDAVRSQRDAGPTGHQHLTAVGRAGPPRQRAHGALEPVHGAGLAGLVVPTQPHRDQHEGPHADDRGVEETGSAGHPPRLDAARGITAHRARHARWACRASRSVLSARPHATRRRKSVITLDRHCGTGENGLAG